MHGIWVLVSTSEYLLILHTQKNERSYYYRRFSVFLGPFWGVYGASCNACKASFGYCLRVSSKFCRDTLLAERKEGSLTLTPPSLIVQRGVYSSLLPATVF